MKNIDHWKRMDAVLRGDAMEQLPISLWRHFPVEDMDPGRLARHTIAWQEKWRFDFVKFMPPGTFSVEDWGAATAYTGATNGARVVTNAAVKRTEDWKKIRHLNARAGSWGQQNVALAQAAGGLNGSVPILQTVFSPLTTARKLATDGMFADIRCNPDALEAALRVITDVTIEFCLDAIRAGAHGIFLATQLASHRLLTVTEYERFGAKYDIEILEALRGRCQFNMLHAHGDDIMFDLLSSYPVQLFNWHDRLTDPDLRRARQKFSQVLVGGLNEHNTLVRGTPQEIAGEVMDAIEQTDGRRLIIGPGCVLPVATADSAIQAVVEAARDHNTVAL
ncbi:Uroporphyrinogen decarboxylase (URO-D) [Cupriavidus taiwanensis]|uniref:uroporphyrinogen decarboxylase family protein n=1 Tax=Cupriavidus taiwanensis TaxID=164546 RepID=UPI000E19E00C|nr:uroporphyrinogen decarboxylase family protein [Cupriavidus taiwanensis]SOY94593.1 Uroporphyrinogen decarboxylase (URO-D) [Cupriavidus taiwanensis]SOY98639.1 Uroporphyrinogen decarboxylase (URO-D) [Cupriavidus taiwanensis]